MERRRFFTRLGTGTIATLLAVPLMANTLKVLKQRKKGGILGKEEIQHMVIFDLHHDKGSELALKFLNDGQRILSNISVVNNFQVFNQVSSKNDYTYGFSMIFSSTSDYDFYTNHPDHVSFVEIRWKKEVTRFQEIDFKPFFK